MRTNLLIDYLGNNINPEQNLINASPVNGNAGSSLFTNQITLTFYNQIIQARNGLYIPERSSVIKTGLSGNIVVTIWAADDAPYTVPITPNNNIDISNSCILQWKGLTDKLALTCNNILGAQYINVLLDRGH